MKKWKIAAATLAGGLSLSTGLAAADVLPGPAQDVASSALSRVGINVPDGDDATTKVSTVKDDQKSEKAKDDPSTPTTKPDHPDNHGSIVSDAAHDKSNVGADHGSAVCTTASGGKCQSNETHGGSGTNSRSGAGSSNSSSNSSGSSTNSGASTDGGANTSTGSSNSSGSSGSSNSSSGGSSSSSGSTSSGGSSSGSSSNSSGSSSGG